MNREETRASAEVQYTRDAFDSFSNAFSEENLRSIGEAEMQFNKDYEIRKRADAIEATKILFNDGDEISRQYREALKKRRLCLFTSRGSKNILTIPIVPTPSSK